MTRLEYANLFFTGRKSQCMQEIEKESPMLEGFHRSEAFFQAFGCISKRIRKGFVMFLPANHECRYLRTEGEFLLANPMFCIYKQAENICHNCMKKLTVAELAVNERSRPSGGICYNCAWKKIDKILSERQPRHGVEQ